MGKRTRWVVGGLGFLLPCSWLGATVLLYAWLPGFRGSGTIFCFILILALFLTGAAVLTAPTGWKRRILRLAVLGTLLLTQVACILGWAYFSMGFGTSQPRIKATADWMKPLESEWGTQSPGKNYSIQSVSEPRELRRDLPAGSNCERGSTTRTCSARPVFGRR